MGQKISVIVPVYKSEKVLSRCIESILSQTYHNLELILVDDGSPDKSGLICDQFAEQDNRVVVIHQKNGGVSAARNAGLNFATGNYLSFVDSDDSILPKMFEHLICVLEQNELDIVSCNAQRVKGEKIKSQSNTGNLEIKESRLAVEECLVNEGAAVWGAVYKKSVINHIRFPEGRKFEDTAVIFHFLANAKRIGHLDTVYYNYYYNMNSITQTAFNVKDRWDFVLANEEAYHYAVDNQYTCVHECNSNLIKSLLSCLTALYALGSKEDYAKYKPLVDQYMKKYRTSYSECRLNGKYRLYYRIYGKCDFIHVLGAKISLKAKQLKKLFINK